MSINLRRVNEELYLFLMQKHDEDRDLKFTLRKSNRAGKLEQGYWFYGTDDYLAISFWTGMDYKNKTPNIYFGILSDGRTYLEVAVSDSEIKRKFITEIILKEYSNSIKIEPSGTRYIKYYSANVDYKVSLENFIENDKKLIDLMIDVNKYFFDQDEKDRIYFISPVNFDETINKIDSYRHNVINNERTSKQELSSLHIREFGPIKDTFLIQFPSNTQWIFLVGENGTGKTSILRAIASGLCHVKVQNESFYFAIKLNSGQDNIVNFIRNGNQTIRKRKPLVSGFCSYGAARLKTNAQFRSKFSFLKSLNKNGLTKSLFDIDTVLIDIQEQLMYWNRDPNLTGIVEKRTEFIRELLIDILPRVINIKFNEQDNWESYYIEKDEDGNALSPVSFDKLASGLKSLIAMIGDMMMRLYNQQPNITDPSELTGIVLIDEIDIHLHPKMQKILVEQLTITFPKIQFVAATHSPIPLLGAPCNTCILRVDRNAANGVELTDLTEININRLLPNAILSSDIFGMNNLFNRNNSSDIKTEDLYSDIILNEKIAIELEQIAIKLKAKR